MFRNSQDDSLAKVSYEDVRAKAISNSSSALLSADVDNITIELTESCVNDLKLVVKLVDPMVWELSIFVMQTLLFF